MSRSLHDVMGENLARSASTAPKSVIECKCCRVQFERGTWCFYSLCNKCFNEFDTCKMNGRFGTGPTCEDVDAWIEGRIR